MTAIAFHSIPTEIVETYQAGGMDANGQPPERHVSEGNGVPCRHCQDFVAKGDEFLILAHCPFPGPQPYAETGPIFLHAEPCKAYPLEAGTPDMILKREQFLLKGYTENHRIAYGASQIVSPGDIQAAAVGLFSRDDIAYIHVRSSLYNCYQCRIERA